MSGERNLVVVSRKLASGLNTGVYRTAPPRDGLGPPQPRRPPQAADSLAREARRESAAPARAGEDDVIEILR